MKRSYFGRIAIAIGAFALEGCPCSGPVSFEEVSVQVTIESTSMPVTGALVTVTPSNGGDPIRLLESTGGTYVGGAAGIGPDLAYQGDYTLRVTASPYAEHVATVHLTAETGGCNPPLVVRVGLSPAP